MPFLWTDAVQTMDPVVECVINDQNHRYPYRGCIEEGAGISVDYALALR